MNAIKNSRINREKRKTLVASLFGFFLSMRFSLFLFGLIAVGSIFGTFVKQGGTEEEYLAIYTENTYKILKLFGIDDVYHSTWFYVLIALFALNLLLCTMRQLGRLAGDRRRQELPNAERLGKMEYSALIPQERKEERIREIKKTYRLVYEDKNGMIFERSAFSRWGVFITHGSIIVILAGALIGAMLGFRGFVVLGVGETKDRIVTEGTNHEERTLGFAIKCKNFKASFYPDGTPKDYVSTVEVIEDKRVVMEKNIRVNDPLSYKGTRIYQSGYGHKMSFAFRIGKEDVVLNEQETVKKGNLMLKVIKFAREVHNFGPGVQIVYSDGEEMKTTWFLPNIDRLRSQTIQGANVKLVDIQDDPYTSLEVSGDPGIPLVWTGFVLILFGLYVTFFTCYRRIFIVNTKNGAIMAGYAMKNKEMFGKEFEKMKEGLDGNGR